MTATPDERQRIDQWLWHARLVKTRSLAAKLCASGAVRVDGTPVAKPHHGLRCGAVLTVAVHDRVRLIRVLALANRRGPAPEAQRLYEELDSPFGGKVPVSARGQGI